MSVCSMHFSSAARVCVTEIAEATLLSVRDNRGVTNENEFVTDVLYIVHKTMKVTSSLRDN